MENRNGKYVKDNDDYGVAVPLNSPVQALLYQLLIKNCINESERFTVNSAGNVPQSATSKTTPIPHPQRKRKPTSTTQKHPTKPQYTKSTAKNNPPKKSTHHFIDAPSPGARLPLDSGHRHSASSPRVVRSTGGGAAAAAATAATPARAAATPASEGRRGVGR